MADDAGGKEVGRISIRVVPSLKKFFDDLKAGIEEAERAFEVHLKVTAKGFEEFRAEVRAETSDLPDAEVKVKPKLDSLDLFQKRMLAQLNQISKDTEPRIGLDVDGERLRRALDKEVAAMSKEVRAKIPVDLELAADQRAKIAAEIEALKELTRTTPIQLKENPEADFSRRQRAAAESKKLAADLTDEERKRNAEILKGQELFRKGQIDEAKIKLKAELEPSTFEKALAEAKAAAKAAGVKIDIDVNDKGAQAKLAEAIAKLKLEARAADINLDLKVGKDGLSEVAKNLTNAGDGAGFAGQQFLGLSRIGWLVTAVFAAAAPVIGLVAGLLAGLPSLLLAAAAPIGAIALGMKGIEGALDASGLMAEGKKGKQGVGATFKTLQDSVSKTFQDGLTPVFRQLLTLMPTVQQGFGGVAQSLVNMASGVTNVVTSSGGIAQIQTIFAGISTFLTGLTPALQAFTSTFLTLGAEGSKSFGLLLTPIQQFATGFDQMIGKVANNGVLTKAFQGLSSTLGSVLNLFTRLFESGLQAMGQLGGPLSTFIDGLGNALIALMPALTTLSSLIGTVGGALGNALAPVITALTPAFTELANVLGGVLSSELSSITPLLTQLAGSLGGALITALNQLTPMIPSLLTSFNQLVTTIANGPLLQALPQLATAFGQLLGVLAQNGPQLMQQLTNAFIQLAPQLPTLIPQVLQLATSFTQLAVGIGPMVPDFITLVQACLPLVQAFTELVGLITPFISVAISMSAAVIGAVGPFLTFQGAVSGLTGVLDTVIAKFQEFSSTAGAKVDEVVGFFKSLPGRIISAIGDLGGQLFTAGANAIQRFVDGITSVDVGGKVGQQLGKITSQIPHSPAKTGPFSGSGWTQLYTGGQAVADQFGQGLEGGLQGVLDRASALMGQINDAIKNGTSVGPGVKDQLKQELAELGIEHDQLRVQLDQTTDKGQKKTLEDQLKQVQAARDQLNLQSDQLGFSKKYGDSVDQNTQMMQGMVTKTAEIGKNFAETNVKQFIGDIGGSGNGAVEQVADIGIGWLSSMFGKAISGGLGGGDTHFHVGSVDEAMSADRTMKSRQALQFKDRS